MSAMMISSIRLDKQPPAMVRVESAQLRQQQQQQQQMETSVATRRQMLAPLASLDCSITEPITDTHTSTTDTPTLSGYFDCDQLSDMVDDSLFEITNTGCLSKSIFNGRSRASPIEEATGGRTEEEEEASAIGKQEEDEDELGSGSCTPTNEQPMSIRALEAIPTSIPAPSQASMVADHQAYDYSSTSTIPARWTQGNSSSSTSHRQRSKSARFSANSSIKSATGEPSSTGESSRIIHKSRRKTRSTSDVRNDCTTGQDENGVCLECQQELLLGGGPAKKKKEKKRFTFSLFNLFTGSGGTSDNQTTFDKKSKNGESCSHRKPSSDGDRNDRNTQQTTGDRSRATNGTSTTSRRRASKTNVPATSSGIRSRDSIRLMNQKKRAIKGSQTISDFQTAPDTATELLLDLTRRPMNQDHEYASHSKLRSSQSSYTVQEERLDVKNNISGGSSSYRSHTRPIKSVKFTMHDKVMIVPPESGDRVPGPAQPPPAYLQPSAPIIKRSVPKSSSYSQTETNKNLEDLLAKYEVNTDLIAELNERLKLTETIASPISVLDQTTNIDTHQEHSMITSDINKVSLHENRDSPNGLRKLENNMVRVETVESSCDDDPSSNQTSGSSSKNDNGGFSSEWLDKQQRGLT